jgi:hypothetical protein
VSAGAVQLMVSVSPAQATDWALAADAGNVRMDAAQRPTKAALVLFRMPSPFA